MVSIQDVIHVRKESVDWELLVEEQIPGLVEAFEYFRNTHPHIADPILGVLHFFEHLADEAESRGWIQSSDRPSIECEEGAGQI